MANFPRSGRGIPKVGPEGTLRTLGGDCACGIIATTYGSSSTKLPAEILASLAEMLEESG